jgi:hypothetical protein
MFFLTRREQMVMILTLTALIMGVGVRHFRMGGMLPRETLRLPYAH